MFLVRTCFASAQARVDRDALQHFHANVAAEALKKILVKQARANQPGIERGQVAKIAVVESKAQAAKRLQAHGGEALRHAGRIAAAVWQRTFSCFVGLQRAIERHVALPPKRILEKSKLPRHAPLNRCCSDSSRTYKPRVFKTAIFKVYERASDSLVRVIAPRSRVWSRAAESARGNLVG